MAYLGRQSGSIGNYIRCNTITPDGSTTTFALTNVLDSSAVFPGNENNVLCQLSGVMQAPGSGNAFTISGSNIVFSDAPEAADTVDFIIILGETVSIGTPSDGTVTAVKIPDDTITKAKVNFISDGTAGVEVKGDGGSNDGYIQLNCSQNSHGIKLKSPAHSAGASYTLIFPNNTGASGQVLSTNGSGTLSFIDAVENKPTITSTSLVIAPSTATSVTIAGTNFATDSTHVPIVEAVNSTGGVTRASVVSWSSATSISATFNLAAGDYRVRVENPDGNAGMSANAILQASTAPTWTTSAGSLGSNANASAISYTVAATSDSAVTYAKTSGTFPGGVSLNTSTGVISGTESGSSSTTTYTFQITPTDAETQAGPAREFTITISHGISGGGQFNG